MIQDRPDPGYLEVPPLWAFLYVARFTLDGMRHAWVLIVNRCHPGYLTVIALGLICYWLWIVCKALPGLMWILAHA